MIIKSDVEIKALREGGKNLASVLHEVIKKVRPGVNARELDDVARQMTLNFGDEPAFLNYTPHGSKRPYPATLCVSVNDEIVHGIPNEEEKILKEGDIVGLDIGLRHNGIYVDMAKTVGVGEISPEAKKLIGVTEEALRIGIKECVMGNHINDIGRAIEKFVKPYKYGIVEELGGHGVGRKQHEEPYIPNYALKGDSQKIVNGMVLALEPMINLGTKHVILADDGYTFKTADHKLSAHFEHTVLVTEKGPEIITLS